MMTPPRATPFWGVHGVAAIARTQTVELDQTSGRFSDAQQHAEKGRRVTKNNTSIV
jgi:hypothetical protein